MERPELPSDSRFHNDRRRTLLRLKSQCLLQGGNKDPQHSTCVSTSPLSAAVPGGREGGQVLRGRGGQPERRVLQAWRETSRDPRWLVGDSEGQEVCGGLQVGRDCSCAVISKGYLVEEPLGGGVV